MNTQELQILKSIVSELQYNNINNILNKTLSPVTYNKVSQWYNNCKLAGIEIPENDLILAAIDQELNTQGVESIFNEGGDRLFSYCNTGDEFGLTVMYYHISGKFIVSSFINIIEAIEENMLDVFITD